ncbi:Spy/CpxP family protein refolding chaperone [Massilia sp. ST3]|uniref:Spy/CpxP family protein refolding chaperone n=1 Tax=Massilia sp. ST3 TaxID=2824903 RepID=UPI001B82614E|nr:periplasmic heavy metal sensor [Massilia sp. ST3]MBQ5947733.1 Spy/CpxP family protein refolding chaperone [Massilia sp. ST3]
MHKMSLQLAAALAACLIAAPAALAQPGRDGPPMERRMEPPRHGGHSGHQRLAGLDLSEAQQDRVFAILHDAAPQRRELDKAERKAHGALREMAGAAQFDAATAGRHAEALGQAVAGQELLRLRTDAQLMAVLTPEQRAQMQRAPRRQDTRRPPRQDRQ